jgi:hypothetical protein
MGYESISDKDVGERRLPEAGPRAVLCGPVMPGVRRP